MLIKSLNIFPKGIDATNVFTELQSLMEKEMDYLREAKVLQRYQELCQDDFFYIPKVYPQYSNHKSICMEYIEGISLSALPIDHFTHSQDKLNLIGQKIFELFLSEIFLYGLVQTDAHGGNFSVNQTLDKVYLLDFGACLDFDPKLLKFYQNFLIYSFYQDRESFLKEFKAFIKYSGNDISFDENLFWEYILLMSSPLRSTDYNWDETKLPDELIKLGNELKKTFVMKSIPAHFIFLDRKLLGIFTLLRSLKCRFNLKESFEKFIKR
jgi:predicted unusual protein kinase regulating ubiquinone biosynthesis (AarF/ABC1/UbiB family)